jgi:hypothetical protein
MKQTVWTRPGWLARSTLHTQTFPSEQEGNHICSTCDACRYIIAETEDTIYVSFVGTKKLQDLLTDFNYWQVPLSPATSSPLQDSIGHGRRPSELSSTGKQGPRAGGSAAATKQGPGGDLMVHQGFAARAESIPIQQMYELARRRKKNLRFCGALRKAQLTLRCGYRLLV